MLSSHQSPSVLQLMLKPQHHLVPLSSHSIPCSTLYQPPSSPAASLFTMFKPQHHLESPLALLSTPPFFSLQSSPLRTTSPSPHSPVPRPSSLPSFRRGRISPWLSWRPLATLTLPVGRVPVSRLPVTIAARVVSVGRMKRSLRGM